MTRSRNNEARRIADLQRNKEREAADRTRTQRLTRFLPSGPGPRGERRRADQDLTNERRLSDEALEAERQDSDRRLEEAGANLAAERAAHARTQGQVATREQLLAIVSHDLKTPLNTILLSLATIGPELCGDGAASGECQAAIARMQRAARLMDRLIADLLDSERMAADKLALNPGWHDLAEIVREAIEGERPNAEAASVSLVADVSDQRVLALCERPRLAQVLGNLVDNAVKHTPPRGKVSIGYRSEPGALLIWVSDTGPGVPPSSRESIFERFSQLSRTDRRSIGLGLFICRRIVEAHGGRIWVEDAPGGGARFVVLLPALAAGSALTERAAP